MEYWNFGIMGKPKELLSGKISNIRLFQYSNVPLLHYFFLPLCGPGDLCGKNGF